MPSPKVKRPSWLRKETESEIQDVVLAWLKAAGYLAIRMPTSGQPIRTAAGIILGRNPLKGFPDIIGVLKHRRGVMFAIELKSLDGKFRAGQAEWLAMLARFGVVAFAARDLHTVVETLKREDVK